MASSTALVIQTAQCLFVCGGSWVIAGLASLIAFHFPLPLPLWSSVDSAFNFGLLTLFHCKPRAPLPHPPFIMVLQTGQGPLHRSPWAAASICCRTGGGSKTLAIPGGNMEVSVVDRAACKHGPQLFRSIRQNSTRYRHKAGLSQTTCDRILS